MKRNIMPAPVGVSSKCELLKTGLSIINLDKYLLNISNKEKDIIT
tara:strand:+ start:236 stop:370 length:135 start_codon:yes stop_codon:yes gene_type:complete